MLKQAEVEVEAKIERSPDFFLSLNLSLNLPAKLADFFSILLISTIRFQPGRCQSLVETVKFFRCEVFIL